MVYHIGHSRRAALEVRKEDNKLKGSNLGTKSQTLVFQQATSIGNSEYGSLKLNGHEDELIYSAD